jgi:hypothetical protein
MRPDRRTVLAGALAGAVAAPAIAKVEPGALTLYDPAEPAARTFAAAQGGRTVPIQGDPIRLARRLFRKGAPDRLTVIGRHADLLLLSEAAREAGYRTLSSDTFPVDGLYLWTALRRT